MSCRGCCKTINRQCCYGKRTRDSRGSTQGSSASSGSTYLARLHPPPSTEHSFSCSPPISPISPVVPPPHNSAARSLPYPAGLAPKHPPAVTAVASLLESRGASRSHQLLPFHRRGLRATDSTRAAAASLAVALAPACSPALGATSDFST
jgi:hypothetical protein